MNEKNAVQNPVSGPRFWGLFFDPSRCSVQYCTLHLAGPFLDPLFDVFFLDFWTTFLRSNFALFLCSKFTLSQVCCFTFELGWLASWLGWLAPGARIRHLALESHPPAPLESRTRPAPPLESSLLSPRVLARVDSRGVGGGRKSARILSTPGAQFNHPVDSRGVGGGDKVPEFCPPPAPVWSNAASAGRFLLYRSAGGDLRPIF